MRKFYVYDSDLKVTMEAETCIYKTFGLVLGWLVWSLMARSTLLRSYGAGQFT